MANGPKRSNGTQRLGGPKRRATQKEKTLRAFGAYLELLDTAAWLKSWMQGPLTSCDLTMQGFRLLMLLYRDGATPMMEAAKRMRFARQNLEYVARRLEKRGWVRRENLKMPAGRQTTLAEHNVRRVGRKPARRMGIIELTPLGEKFVAQVFPRQAKVAKALMRALDGREQETLAEICRKLRAGHIIKFMSEITHPDAWDEDARVQSGDEEEKQKLSQLLKRRMPAPVDPKETLIRSLKGGDRERLAGIAETMRSRDIVRYARNVHWNKPPDTERDSRTAVNILMRMGNERERKLLEQMTRAMQPPEIIEFLRAINGAVTNG